MGNVMPHDSLPMRVFKDTWQLASDEYFEQGTESMNSTWHVLIGEFRIRVLILNFKFRLGCRFWSATHYK